MIHNVHKLYVTPGLLWRDDLDKAQLKFSPVVLLVDSVDTPLGSVPNEPVLVVVDTDIKLPPRMAVSDRGRMVTKRKLENKIFQITRVGKWSPEEEELALCETVVEGAKLLPIMLTN